MSDGRPDQQFRVLVRRAVVFPKFTGTVVKTAGFVFSPRCFLHVAVAGLSPIHAGVAAHFRGIRRREASLRE